MSKIFIGRPVMSGAVIGEALVTRRGFNTLASYQKSVVLRQKRAVCSDQNNPDLRNRVINDKILCLPQTIGSTAGGLAIMTVAKMGLAPKAFLFSQPIDSLAAAGVTLSEVWFDYRIVTIDSLGEEFLDYVEEGYIVEVMADGQVVVRK